MDTLEAAPFSFFCQNKFIIQKAFFHLIFVINELVFLKSLIKGFFEQDIGGFPTKSDSRKKERTDGHYITFDLLVHLKDQIIHSFL